MALPRRAAVLDPGGIPARAAEDAVQYTAVIDARIASRFVGQKRLDHTPLEVGQAISAHGELESEASTKGKPSPAFSPIDDELCF